MLTAIESQRLISAFILRLRMRSPFFATLAMYARFLPTEAIETTATNGSDVFYNPTIVNTLTPKQLDACLLHQVLHAAFMHPLNHGSRNAKLWNIAADIVVNGVLATQDFVELIPATSLRDKALEKRPIEELYEILLTTTHAHQLACSCFVSAAGLPEDPLPQLGAKQRAERQAYWNQALRQAEVVQRSVFSGQMPAGLEAVLKYLAEQRADWRVSLWRFLIKTPADFAGFDRRMLGRGLYLDDTLIEPVMIYVCIDVESGVDQEQQTTFLQELGGVLSAYPHLTAQLFYQSNGLSGPHEPSPGALLPLLPQKQLPGSLWEYMQQDTAQRHVQALCVYVTDGFGELPAEAPDLPLLWLVTPGGRDVEQFPWGQAARLLRFI